MNSPNIAVSQLLAQIAATGSVWITIRTDSMQPTLRPGDQVELTAASAIRLFDIVAVTDPARTAQLTVHRVAGIFGKRVVHAGDAKEGSWDLIDRSRVVGVVRFVSPHPERDGSAHAGGSGPGTISPPPPAHPILWRAKTLLRVALRIVREPAILKSG